jgi:ribosomal protein S18 acetylase RimI-like enzyme
VPTNCSTRSLTLRPAVTESALVLEVPESNIRAMRSYSSYGFVETGRRRTLDRDPSITEIELAYPLAGTRHA